MKRFAMLYDELDASTSTNDKVRALATYFREATDSREAAGFREASAPPVAAHASAASATHATETPPHAHSPQDLSHAQAADCAWALWIFTGGRIKRAVTSTQLREALAKATGLPAWLIEESYEHVGDLSETIALLLANTSTGTGTGTGTGTDTDIGIRDEQASAASNQPGPPPPRPLSLASVIENTILPMQRMDAAQRIDALVHAWRQLHPAHRFVFHKLISGSFRVGVSRTLVVRALAQAFGVSQAEIAHRVMGSWQPTPQAFARIVAKETPAHAASVQPYPFCLASPLESAEADLHAELGACDQWIAEWKWDGIRAQALRREGSVSIWSRGEELLTERFGELASALSDLPAGTVLDGEVLAWDEARDAPAPFSTLQTRITRTTHRAQELLFVDVPVRFVAYDLLEHAGRDVRREPLETRRYLMQQTLESLAPRPRLLRTSEVLRAASWSELAQLRATSRERGVEGLMLKRASSAYGTGRERGVWWKWKVDPFSLDVVMVAAQPGHGRRASVYTDYTFAVWSGSERGAGELVTLAKAYSGLTDDEIDRVDAWIRKHTLARHGPVRSVEPAMVFELAFEGLQESPRHKAGIALRFPRIAKVRSDKRPHEADCMSQVRALLRGVSKGEASKANRDERSAISDE